MFPKTASIQQLQRDYRTILDQTMQTKEPIVILNKNKPEVVIIEIHEFEQIQEKAQKYELEMAKKAIATYQEEKSGKKLKRLKSLMDLAK
jgi:prevent-host-death family protein